MTDRDRQSGRETHRERERERARERERERGQKRQIEGCPLAAVKPGPGSVIRTVPGVWAQIKGGLSVS